MHFKEVKYSIGQVSEMLELPQSVLRYWETVFPSLNPEKTPGGTRRYSLDDINHLSEIKKLLYDKGFTIKGARHALISQENENTQDENVKIKIGTLHQISGIISELNDILKSLKNS